MNGTLFYALFSATPVQLSRGVGTRNDIVILGLTSQTAAYALLSTGEFSEHASNSYTRVIETVLGAGGTVIIPQNDPVLRTKHIRQLLRGPQPVEPSLDYAQVPGQSGLHIMHLPTGDWNEILTGLGATGVEMMLAFLQHPMPTHPMIPLIQMGLGSALSSHSKRDMDLCLDTAASSWQEQLLSLMVDVANGDG